MKGKEFIACSLAVHAALLVFALLLPPPFPSPRFNKEDITYVDVTDTKPAAPEPIAVNTYKSAGKARGLGGGPGGTGEGPEGGGGGEDSVAAGTDPDLNGGGPGKGSVGGKKGGRPGKTAKGGTPGKAGKAAKGAKADTGKKKKPARVPPKPVIKPGEIAVNNPPPPEFTETPEKSDSGKSAGRIGKKETGAGRDNAAKPASQPKKTETVVAAAKQPAPTPESPAAPGGGSGVVAPKKRRVGIEAEKTSLSFKFYKGRPAPSMARLKIDPFGMEGGAMDWRADTAADWVILSRKSGRAPCSLKVGVNAARLSAGYYEATVKVVPVEADARADEIDVTLMVLPGPPATPNLPHYAYDSYMNGDCKVCHLPEAVMPKKGMSKPDFCSLCHSEAGMASGCLAKRGGHPVMVAAGSGGTKLPTRGTVSSGPKGNRMDTQLYDGKVVCVTCHNVMEKQGDYGRTWELASTKDHRTYYLSEGGWENLGCLKLKVFVTDSLIQMPKTIKDQADYLVEPSEYTFDEAEGSVTFKRRLGKSDTVYATLASPYLRGTTENNVLCYDCHNENTHQGLPCLACHQMHGTDNIKAVRRFVRTPEHEDRRVVFRATKGRGSFADGGMDGVCVVCHTETKCYRYGDKSARHQNGRDYTGADCSRCHSHANGFSAG